MALRLNQVGARSCNSEAATSSVCKTGRAAEVPDRRHQGVHTKMVPVIKSPHNFHFTKIGRHIPRDRYQHRRVEETGKKSKKWKGYFYIYVVTAHGKEKRKHRSVLLGLKERVYPGNPIECEGHRRGARSKTFWVLNTIGHKSKLRGS